MTRNKAYLFFTWGFIFILTACTGGLKTSQTLGLTGQNEESSKGDPSPSPNPLPTPTPTPTPAPIPLPTPTPTPTLPANRTGVSVSTPVYPDVSENFHVFFDPLIKNSQGTILNLHGAVPAVRGTIKLDLELIPFYSDPILSLQSNSVTVLYTLDGEILPGQASVTGPSFAIDLDTTRISDGTHAIGSKVIWSTGSPYPTHKFYSQTRQFIVQNNGPLNGAQRVPVVGTNFLSYHMPPAVDWLNFTSPRQNVGRPFPAKFYPPSSDPALRSNANWFLEPVDRVKNGLYRTSPEFFKTQSGGVFVGQYLPELNAQAESSWHSFNMHGHNNFDGERNDNKIDPYTTFISAPDGDGWLGVDFFGRIIRLTNSGKVTTLFGLRQSRSVLPIDFNAHTSLTDFLSVSTGVGVVIDSSSYSTCESCFQMATDLAADPRNAKILYVADALNHRIAKVDLTKSPPEMKTYAGLRGISGYRDGSISTATFNTPHSLVMGQDGTLYVADFKNSAIRMVSPDGQSVSTLAGGTVAGVTISDYATVYTNRSNYNYRTETPFASAPLPFPITLRFDSQANLIVADPITRSIKKIDMVSRRIKDLYFNAAISATQANWVWIDVDRKGNVGPKDDVFMAISVGSPGNMSVYRVSKEGTFIGDMGKTGPAPHGPSAIDLFGHYPWAIAISETEARILAVGIGNDGLCMLRPIQAGDPTPNDILSSHWLLWLRGLEIYERGTIPEFPWTSRPSFSSLWGSLGFGRVVGTFDDIVADYPGDDELATFIRAGMGGSIARPEITGNDMAALIYFIRRYSTQQGVLNLYRPPATSTDRTQPVISNVQVQSIGNRSMRVTYTTDKPTLGFAAWGLDENYYGNSDVETAYSTAHSLTISNFPSNVSTFHFSILAKDQIGNQQRTADAAFTVTP